MSQLEAHQILFRTEDAPDASEQGWGDADFWEQIETNPIEKATEHLEVRLEDTTNDVVYSEESSTWIRDWAYAIMGSEDRRLAFQDMERYLEKDPDSGPRSFPRRLDALDLFFHHFYMDRIFVQ